jgi:hypothetical protein
MSVRAMALSKLGDEELATVSGASGLEAALVQGGSLLERPTFGERFK